MKLEEKFEDREELTRAFEEAIAQDEQSRYYLRGLKELNDRLAEETVRAEELQKSLNEARETLAATETNSWSELRAKLESLANEKEELANASTARDETIKTLQEENEAFREQANVARIRDALFAEAKHAGIRIEAFRDVQRLESMFHIDERGEIVTEDGRSVREVVEEEKSLSPHWLPASIGGGSVPGQFRIDGHDLFEQARRDGNLRAMIANAPDVE